MVTVEEAATATSEEVDDGWGGRWLCSVLRNGDGDKGSVQQRGQY
jgi:hypothetical protein